MDEINYKIIEAEIEKLNIKLDMANANLEHIIKLINLQDQ